MRKQTEREKVIDDINKGKLEVRGERCQHCPFRPNSRFANLEPNLHSITKMRTCHMNGWENFKKTGKKPVSCRGLAIKLKKAKK